MLSPEKLVLLSDIVSYFIAVNVFVILKTENFVLVQPRRNLAPVPRSTCWSECSIHKTYESQHV